MAKQDSLAQETARGDCYRLMAACFYEPQKEVFAREEIFKHLTDSLRQVYPPAAAISETMGRAFSCSSEEDLLVEYAKLFVGPNALAAPPYGSVYLDNERKVMGNSTMAVLELYREAGLVLSDEFKELPDHIAAELEFMYYLLHREAEAVATSDQTAAMRFSTMQRAFVDRFLGRWVGPFCGKIKEGTGSAFYHALADCVSLFVLHAPIPQTRQGAMNPDTEGVAASASP